MSVNWWITDEELPQIYQLLWHFALVVSGIFSDCFRSLAKEIPGWITVSESCWSVLEENIWPLTSNHSLKHDYRVSERLTGANYWTYRAFSHVSLHTGLIHRQPVIPPLTHTERSIRGSAQTVSPSWRDWSPLRVESDRLTEETGRRSAGLQPFPGPADILSWRWFDIPVRALSFLLFTMWSIKLFRDY